MHRHCDTEDDASFLHERIRASWGDGWGSMEALGTVRNNAMCFFFQGCTLHQRNEKDCSVGGEEIAVPLSGQRAGI